MELLDRIEQQMSATRLPLFAITVAAVPCPDTPVILTLHWHAFLREKLADVEGAQPVSFKSVPSSALQVNDRWDRFDELELAVLDVAWELGSWDLARREAPPFIRPGSDAQESLECMGAFGNLPIAIEGHAPVVAEVPDGEELIDTAGRAGYVQWLFRPVRGGVWAEVADDMTLESGGYRNPPCPHLSAPTRPGASRRVVYQFGRSERLVT
jgi:hypothetical protein